MRLLSTWLSSADRGVSESVVDLRWPPLTAAMLLISAWWVKDLVFVLAAAWSDLRARRVPWSAALVAMAVALAPVVYGPLKSAIGRPRPFAQHLWSGLGPLPLSGSMPSGHATTAAAAATVIVLLRPGLRLIAVLGAAAICLSRVYLGVHFASDVLAGAGLGALLGAAIVWLGRRALGHRLEASAGRG